MSLTILCMSAFGQAERQILVTPNAEHPQAAKDSGLGGIVTVYVTVDGSGNVTAIGDVVGPGNTCPSVTRVDVVALRESAKSAAINAKFAADPGALPVTIPLNFEFPSGSTSTAETKTTDGRPNRFTVVGDRSYSASNTPPPDYTGPAVFGGSNSGAPASGPAGSVPKQISGGVLNGKAMNLPKPPYPPAARAVRASGAVSIQVLITEEGDVFSAAAVSGHPLLRSAARQAACGAQFSPTLLMGNPVKVSGVITYNFVP